MSLSKYRDLDKVDIQSILSAYNLENSFSFSSLHGGTENSSYVIDTKEHNYILTICEQRDIEDTKLLGSLLRYLSDKGFKTSRIVLTKNNEVLSLWNSVPVMLKEYISGKVMYDLSPHLLQEAGREMGKLHLIEPMEFLSETIGPSMRDFDHLRTFENKSDFLEWLKHKEALFKPIFTNDLPKCLTHGDLFYDNMIVSEDEQSVTIMDFEEAGYFYRIFDVGMALVGMCLDQQKIDLNKAVDFLQGYSEIIELQRNEKDDLNMAIVYAATTVAVWRYKYYHYIHPTESRKMSYVEMANVADEILQLDIDWDDVLNS